MEDEPRKNPDEQGREQDRRRESSRQLRDKRPGRRIDNLGNVDTRSLNVSANSREAWCRIHKEDERRSRYGIRDTVAALLERGHHAEGDNGAHILWCDGYRIVLSPDKGTVIAYSTLHKERTIMQLRKGTPSNMRKGKVGPLGLTRRLDDDAIDRIAIPYALVRKVLENDGIDIDDNREKEAARADIRDSIAEAMDELDGILDGKKAPCDLDARGNPLAPLHIGETYTWMPDGTHRIEAPDWILTLRADGMRIRSLETKKA